MDSMHLLTNMRQPGILQGMRTVNHTRFLTDCQLLGVLLNFDTMAFDGVRVS
jgi:hypothetical protein